MCSAGRLNPLFRFRDVYSLDLDEAREIRDQALASLSVLGLENINKFPLYEPETRLHRASLEASVIV
jgi:hypothetical protein